MSSHEEKITPILDSNLTKLDAEKIECLEQIRKLTLEHMHRLSKIDVTDDDSFHDANEQVEKCVIEVLIQERIPPDILQETQILNFLAKSGEIIKLKSKINEMLDLCKYYDEETIKNINNTPIKLIGENSNQEIINMAIDIELRDILLNIKNLYCCEEPKFIPLLICEYLTNINFSDINESNYKIIIEELVRNILSTLSIDYNSDQFDKIVDTFSVYVRDFIDGDEDHVKLSNKFVESIKEIMDSK